MEKSSAFATGAVPKSKKITPVTPPESTVGNDHVELDAMLKDLQSSLASFPAFEGEMNPISKNYMKHPLLHQQQKGLTSLDWRENQPFPGGLVANDWNFDPIVPFLALIAATKDIPNAYSSIFLSRGDKIKRSYATLLICKASKIDEWRKIIKEHCIGLKVEVYHGPTRSTLEETLHLQDIVLTSYETVRNEIGMIGIADKKVPDVLTYFDDTQTEEVSKSVLLRIYFHRVILDQAEEIKNPTSAQSVSVCRIRSTYKWVIIPDAIRNEQMYAYVRFLKISPLDLGENTKSGRNSTLALRLRQLCSAPALLKTMLKQKGQADIIKEAIPEEERKCFFYRTNTTIKLKTVVSLVSDIISEKDETKASVEAKAGMDKVNGQQVIVVSHWTTVLEVLKQRLGGKAELISSEIPQAKRIDIIAKFNQKHPVFKVLLLTMEMTGADLSGADHIFFMDIDPCSSVQEEAIRKMIYLSSPRQKVVVHHMITKGTVEERVFSVQSAGNKADDPNDLNKTISEKKEEPEEK